MRWPKKGINLDILKIYKNSNKNIWCVNKASEQHYYNLSLNIRGSDF